jgi:triosephosphate isomerase
LTSGGGRSVDVGVSLKLYLGVEASVRWAHAVAAATTDLGRTIDGVTVWVAPSFPVLTLVRDALAGTQVGLAAQDLHWEDRGAYTGAVSGADLADIGCRYVEIGHMERRRYFGESDEIVAAKVAAARRNGLVPVLCVGEPEANRSPDLAAAACLAQLDDSTRDAGLGAADRVILAYEPYWAIGAAEPAPADHVAHVCERLRRGAADRGLGDVRVVYGGSAGPGTLTALRDAVDGVFLGRFAHDVDALAAVLREAAVLANSNGG